MPIGMLTRRFAEAIGPALDALGIAITFVDEDCVVTALRL